MNHFRSIDGLRAWLAWAVVMTHVTLYTAADHRWPVLGKLEYAGDISVYIFIIISGFVITHLLLEKRERYLPYISRRFLRIYPLYLVCLACGIGATYLYIGAFADYPWGDLVPQPEIFGPEAASLANGDFLRHLIAHLLLLHGAISSSVLPVSSYMFLGPAWSLSLEWQFYLVAPFIIAALGSRLGASLVAMLAVGGYAAYQLGWFGQFIEPSILPGASLYFAVGIASRVLFAKLPEFKVYPVAALIIACGFYLVSHQLLPFVMWMAFVAWLRTAPSACNPVGRVLNAAFKSDAARYLGTRSYSTYLIHVPIMHTIIFLCVKPLALSFMPTLIITFVGSVLLTLAASAVLYRLLEAPAIAFGKRMFVSAPASASEMIAP